MLRRAPRFQVQSATALLFRPRPRVCGAFAKKLRPLAQFQRRGIRGNGGRRTAERAIARSRSLPSTSTVGVFVSFAQAGEHSNRLNPRATKRAQRHRPGPSGAALRLRVVDATEIGLSLPGIAGFIRANNCPTRRSGVGKFLPPFVQRTWGFATGGARHSVLPVGSRHVLCLAIKGRPRFTVRATALLRSFGSAWCSPR